MSYFKYVKYLNFIKDNFQRQFLAQWRHTEGGPIVHTPYLRPWLDLQPS